jgi:hypothetical protein
MQVVKSIGKQFKNFMLMTIEIIFASVMYDWCGIIGLCLVVLYLLVKNMEG